jgi:hypothetical protein
MMRQILVLLLLLISQAILGQTCRRSDAGEMAGFTKCEWETEIIRLERPFIVRKVNGTIIRSVGDGSPIEGVIFELRGPNGSQIVRSARTDTNGRFNLRRMPAGRYLFKATTKGFATFVGEVVVSAGAPLSVAIDLQMTPGL